MVIACGEDAQVVRGRDRRRIAALAIPSRKSVLGNGGFSDIVATLRADEETLVAQCDIEGRGRAFKDVGEQAGVDVGLLVQDVKFAAVGGFCGEVVGQDFSFEAFGQVVFEFEFRVETVGGGPGLGEGES